MRLLEGVAGTSIVYVRSRRKTEEIATALNRRGIKAAAYHAGLDPQERDKRQAAWLQDELRVIVATNAFGMGIDKPDVRSVVHWEMPDSPEAYFQEAGRAGRDGQASYALLLSQERDAELLLERHQISYPEPAEIRRVYRALGAYFQLAIGAGKDESFDFRLPEFAKTYGLEQLSTYYCLRALEKTGYLLLTDAVHQPARLQFLVEKEALYDYQLKNPQTSKIIKSILRTSQGAFSSSVRLREGQLANFLGLPQVQLQAIFKQLAQDKIIDYFPTKELPQLIFTTERLDADNLNLDLKNYHFRRDRDRHRIDTMIAYAGEDSCRSQQLLSYFGEEDSVPCGRCDVCLAERHRLLGKTPDQTLYDRIESWLAEESAIPVEDIKNRLNPTELEEFLAALNHWVAEGLLRLEGGYLKRG